MRWDEDETRHDQGRVDRWLALAGIVLIVFLVGCAAWVFVSVAGPARATGTYIVTTPYPLLPQRPIAVTATDRLDAVTRIGLTVYTPTEWAALCRESGHETWCENVDRRRIR